MSKDIIYRQDAIDAMCTWDKFGVDERGRVVRWYEGLEPYVHLRDVVIAIANLPPAESEIIYCKDCVHHIDGFFCRQANHHTSDKDSCTSVFRAERRTDDFEK